jgi:hypothetical protein
MELKEKLDRPVDDRVAETTSVPASLRDAPHASIPS